MIVDRYEPVNLLERVPELEADFDAELRVLDQLLEDDAIVACVKGDLARRCPHSLTLGRHGTPVEVVLRLLLLKRLYSWSYAEVVRFVAQSLILRQFCRLYHHALPDRSTLIRWAQHLDPATIAQVNDRVVDLAQQHKVTRGRKLRVDSTVVETNIHYPTDSRILGDGVRVLSRLLRRAKAQLPAADLSSALFRRRTRSVRRLTQQLHRVARRKGETAAEELKQAYAKLIAIAQASRDQATAVQALLQAQATPAAQRLRAKFDHFLPLVDQAIGQATRRVLQGEKVPADEKLLSLFEPHTQTIVRHKAGKDVEFGRKLWLDEVDGGIISRYKLLAEGGGLDHPHFPASLAAHQAQFGHPPRLVAGDRGVFSPENERVARELGVKQVVLPQTGRVSQARQAHERQRWFRQGFRFRAGIEGRISVVRRWFEVARCWEHGEAGIGRWVGWGIVAANLAKIATTLVDRAKRAARKQAKQTDRR
jgi:transposase, IS5 family